MFYKNGSASACSINMPIDFDEEKEMEIDDLDPWFFPLPSAAHQKCRIQPGPNDDFMTTVYRVVLSSPAIPDLTVDCDMSRRTFSIAHQKDVGNISADVQGNGSVGWKEWKDVTAKNGSVGWKDYSEKYLSKMKNVISHDGVTIPMTILYSPATYRAGQSPGLLYGYDAYGKALDTTLSSNRLSLLDRGWLVAFAIVRGGDGASWHKSCRGSKKLNSMEDFVSCAQTLINDGLIHKDRLTARSMSVGGLLVGAVVNMHPQLFRAAILEVPCLVVLNSLLDPTSPLSAELNFEEFGNPQILSSFEYILKYSPYENIHEGACYPSMLVKAGLNDSRVRVWEVAKWVAKLRDTTCPRCSSAVILRTSMDEGHIAWDGRFVSRRENAYEYAFLIKNTTILQD